MKQKHTSLKPTDFEVVMHHVRRLSYDQKVALAKYLALTEGVKMYTPSEARKFIDEQVKKEVDERLNLQRGRILIP